MMRCFEIHVQVEQNTMTNFWWGRARIFDSVNDKFLVETKICDSRDPNRAAAYALTEAALLMEKLP